MKKLNKEQIEQIKFKLNSGAKIRHLAKEYNVSAMTIVYHSSDERKNKIIENVKKSFMKKPLEERRKVYNKYKKYRRDYFRNKYQTNEQFRKKELERAKRNNKLEQQLKGGSKNDTRR